MKRTQIQLTIFDVLNEMPQNKAIAEIIGCEETRLLNAIAQSVVNFQELPKDQKYILSFSGGKDSHVLLAIYHLYLKLGNDPLDLVVRFADTNLEHSSLYRSIDLAKQYCDRHKIPFEIVRGKLSYWYIQFALGYPVPTHFARWCTGKLKVIPMQPSRKLKPITGRHLGESKARDERLKKACGSDTCGTDKLKDKYDPLWHWSNCLIWDALYYFDNTLLYQDCFNILQQQYEVAEDSKTGSLRLGCFMCPVIAISTIKKNYDSGLIDENGLKVRYLLEELRGAKRINNQRTQKSGAIYVGDRRVFWEKLNKNYLLEMNYIAQSDIDVITRSLQSDYSYPPTYKKEWIDLQHSLIEKYDVCYLF